MEELLRRLERFAEMAIAADGTNHAPGIINMASLIEAGFVIHLPRNVNERVRVEYMGA
jgi:hypothetical protein